MAVEQITIQRFDDKGNLLGTATVERYYDEAHRAIREDYRAKTLALLQSTGVPVVVKDWVRALNDVLRYLDSEV